MSEKAKSNLPRHATHRYHTALAASGLVLSLIGGTGLFVELTTPEATAHLFVLSSVCLGIGSLFAVLGYRGRQLGPGVQLVNTSYDLIGRGRFAEAEALLDEAERHHPNALVDRVAAVQRGLIAMRRGEIEKALVALDRSIASKGSLFHRTQLRIQAINAQGIRAFLRAASGDRKGARADIEAVRESADAVPQALARVALAEAICIERAGDREVLREHLAQHHELLFDVTDRRERAIVRAFQRMLESTATSIYRKGAKHSDATEEPPLADWIAQVVPEAAPFVETNSIREKTGELPELKQPSERAKKAIAAARKGAEKEAANTGPNRLGRLAMVSVVGSVLYLVISELLAPALPPANLEGGIEPDLPPEPDRLQAMSYTVVGAFVFAFAMAGVQLFKARQEQKRLLQALTLVAKGDAVQGRQDLRALSKGRYVLSAAQAHLTLAIEAERDGDLEGSLHEADQGLARLSRYVTRISASDILLPDLISQRAFVLAAMDRVDEANAELATLPPAYPFISRALYRVRLVALARAGKLDEAAALAAQAGLDLPLSCRDELLTDVVRAVASPEAVGAAEIARIRRELRTSKRLRQWLEIVAPKAIMAFERAAEEASAPEGAEAERNAMAEAEAEAEANAAEPRYLASTVSK